MVTLEQWQQAQQEERKQHTMPYDVGVAHYKRSYDNYFKYLGIDYNHAGKTIIEIGPADFPALQHVIAQFKIVVEPMPSPILQKICTENGIDLFIEPIEKSFLPPSDEIWLFNVLQHVIDPETFIQRCKLSAKVIRWFEPINYPVDACHLHVLKADDFTRWFGATNIYNDKIAGFHQWTCAYGSYDNI